MSSSAVLALLWFVSADPNQAQVAEAKRLFEIGQQFYKKNEYLDAAVAFERAFAIVPNPAIRFSLGQSYRLHFFKTGDSAYLQRALVTYKAYLRDAPERGRQKDAVELIANLELQRISLGLPAVEARSVKPNKDVKTPTQIMVSISPNVAEAWVSVDGGEKHGLPLRAEVEPGEHRVRVEAPGYFTEETTMTALEGLLVPSQVNLRPKPAVVRLEAPEDAEVQLDGRIVGVTPLRRPLEMQAGTHQVVVIRPGKHPFVQELDLGLGEDVNIDAEMETTSQRIVAHWFLAAGAVAFAASVASVLVAAFSEGRARTILQKIEEDDENITEQELEDYIDARDTRNNLRDASISGIVAGALFGGVGAFLYFFDDGRSGIPDVGASGSRIGTVSGVGVGVQGRF